MKTIREILSELSGEAFNIDSLDDEVLFPANAEKDVELACVFVAIKGNNFDAHNLLPEVFKKGAKLAVVEDESFIAKYPVIKVQSTRRAWSKLASIFCGEPSNDMLVAGVTGTNGKTSIQYMLSQALDIRGASVLRIGTLGIVADNKLVAESLTTPDAMQIQKAMRDALDQLIGVAVLEVSSHGLAQQRVADVDFDVAIYSNLSRDHLDYHESFDEYFEAKKELFTLLAKSKKPDTVAVVNVDDDKGQDLIKYCKSVPISKVITYGQSEKSSVRIADFSLTALGSLIHFVIEGQEYSCQSKVIGKHNVYNLAAVLGALLGIGVKPVDAINLLEKLESAPGRLESVGTKELPVYVDYAHTPDALENVLATLQPLCSGKLWVVFGCGGDRDKGKRSEMGEIAARLADKVVVTSDNPRTEDPQSIIADILSTGIKPELTEIDREQAIIKSLKAATAGDIVLIAGKGHEDYQILGTEKIHFSDQEIVRRELGTVDEG